MYNPIDLMNFRVYELVSKQIFDILGSNSWSLFNREFIKDVDKFITDLKKDEGCTSCIVNDWYWQGGYEQSGFREANSDVGSPKSRHRVGNALDLKFVGCTLDTALDYLITNQDRYPNIRRYENLEYTRSSNKYGGWLHLDGKLNEPKLRGFNP